MKNLKTNIEWALYYKSIGWSPFPLSKGSKIPTAAWKKYQTETASEDEIMLLWEPEPEANIGIATGKISGFFVFDIDAKHGRSSKEFQIPPTVCARTGGGGGHYYFKYFGEHMPNSVGSLFGVGVDVRADGGLVVAPPSLHASGNFYEWIVSPDDTEIAEAPEWLKEKLFSEKGKTESQFDIKEIMGAQHGSRNDNIHRLACSLYSKGYPDEDVVFIASQINRTYNPPLGQHSEDKPGEFEKTLISAKNFIASEETSGCKKTANIPHLWTMGEILSHDFGEEEWLVESLISKQGMTAISGNPGDYKTWVTIHVALCMSRDVPVFNRFKAAQGGVLVIDEEDHLRLLKKRLELLGARETDNIHYLSQNGIKVDDEVERDHIVEIVKEKNIKLLILDSLVRVHGQDENDAKGMAKVFSNLQKILHAGASILFTHHHRKQGFGKNNPGQNMRGSSDILAAVDCHITVEKKQDEERLIIKQTKLRQAELLPSFEVSILKGEFGPSGFEYAGDHDDKKEKAEEAAAAVVILLTTEGMQCREDIINALRGECGGKTAIEDGIKIAKEKGDIVKVPKEELDKDQRKKAYYRIPPKNYSNIPGTDSYEEVRDDLPASQLYIGTGKQEDAGDIELNDF